MKGILADVNTIGPIDFLVQRMQAEPWAEFWQELGLFIGASRTLAYRPIQAIWRFGNAVRTSNCC